ncbi:MAG: hypothetical protein ACP5SG_08645 [Dissulfurimicrobium sp.]
MKPCVRGDIHHSSGLITAKVFAAVLVKLEIQLPCHRTTASGLVIKRL